MAVGAFTLTNDGLTGHLDGTIDVDSGAFYAILTTHAGGAPDPVTDGTYADISAQETVDGDYAAQDAVLTVAESAAGPPNIVKVDMPAESDFGAAVTISARYWWLLQGAEAGPLAGDRTLGFMDLNDGGAGDVSSITSDFKVRANAVNGLYLTTKAP